MKAWGISAHDAAPCSWKDGFMLRLTLTLAIGLSCLAGPLGQAVEKPRVPGPTADGFLLPNGWTISPAGEQVILTDLPLNIVPLPDSQHALVAASGYNKHELSLVDLKGLRVLEKLEVRQSWFGLQFDPKANTGWWSGGGANVLHPFTWKDGKLTRTGPAEPVGRTRPDPAKMPAFKSGLKLDHKNQILYSLDIAAGTITALGLKDFEPLRTAKAGERPYDVALARSGALLYVSDWAMRTVLVLEPKELRTVARIAVGEHPNQLAVHPKDHRLFVACASSNCVSVIDALRGTVTETIMTALFPRAPEGSTPDALAISPDGNTLYVANADNNCVAVIDIAVPGKSEIKGFIPTGWYPTAVAVTPDGKHLLIGVGKALLINNSAVFL